jgi:dihydrofolate reductase
MRKLVSFIHLTLDGFAAGPKSEMDWVIVNDEMFEIAGQQTNDADTALYGRVTYQLMQAYWPTAADKPSPSKHDIEHSAWYNKVEKVIISKSMHGQKLPNTTIISDNLTDRINELKNKPGKNIIIFGSPSATRSLMELDLVDELWIFLDPLVLGRGILFFGRVNEIRKLNLLDAKKLSLGVVCLHYERER